MSPKNSDWEAKVSVNETSNPFADEWRLIAGMRSSTRAAYAEVSYAYLKKNRARMAQTSMIRTSSDYDQGHTTWERHKAHITSSNPAIIQGYGFISCRGSLRKFCYSYCQAYSSWLQVLSNEMQALNNEMQVLNNEMQMLSNASPHQA